jgi:transposase
MQAIPLRMRELIVRKYDQGRRTSEIALELGTSRSGTRRIRQVLRERGTLRPRRTKPGRKGGLTDERADQLRGLVATDPDATLPELRDRLGVAADRRTVGRWVKRLGLVLKKSRSGPPSGPGPTSPPPATRGTAGSPA